MTKIKYNQLSVKILHPQMNYNSTPSCTAVFVKPQSFLQWLNPSPVTRKEPISMKSMAVESAYVQLKRGYDPCLMSSLNLLKTNISTWSFICLVGKKRQEALIFALPLKKSTEDGGVPSSGLTDAKNQMPHTYTTLAQSPPCSTKKVKEIKI